jgi:hypothetical protein
MHSGEEENCLEVPSMVLDTEQAQRGLWGLAAAHHIPYLTELTVGMHGTQRRVLGGEG